MPTPDPTPAQRPSRPRTTNPASHTRRWLPALAALPLLALGLPSAQADDELLFPPALADGGTASRDHSDRFLQPPADATLAADIEIAATAPQIDLILYPGQDYPGQPWSTWGEGTHADGIYYYVPGAHGGAERDGSPVVQMDLQTGTRKVLAFLHPYYEERHGLALKGTYGVTISEAGDRLFITWNASRGSRAWDCCALTVIRIPPSERQETDR